eukprot:m.40721 g.40721  ORF g.40721 m.40721 type:complete len:423 (-) comp6017_c0_seq1:1528-2796(-)
MGAHHWTDGALFPIMVALMCGIGIGYGLGGLSGPGRGCDSAAPRPVQIVYKPQGRFEQAPAAGMSSQANVSTALATHQPHTIDSSRDAREWVTVVITSGTPEPKTDPKEEKDRQAGVARHFLRLRLWSRSLVTSLEADAANMKNRRVRLIAVGDTEGLQAVKEGMEAARKFVKVWPIAQFDTVALTAAEIRTKTDPLLKSGLTSSYVFRLWDFGKFWAPSVLPETVHTALFTDVDIVFRPGISKIFDWHDAKRKENSEWIVGGVNEPMNYAGKPPSPWEMKNITSPRYVNTGIMLINLDRYNEFGFLKRLPQSIESFTKSEFFRRSSQSQWPPEQWAFNVALGTYPESFIMLPSEWSVDCVSDSGPWGANRNTDVFSTLKSKAYLIHYCNNQVGTLLSKEECQAVTDPKEHEIRCHSASFSL